MIEEFRKRMLGFPSLKYIANTSQSLDIVGELLLDIQWDFVFVCHFEL